jgi:hypothetical protein
VTAAITKARATVAEKKPDLPPAELDRIAEQAGIAAVKYADLSTSRTKGLPVRGGSDDVLDRQHRRYLQNAHARIRSLLVKAGTAAGPIDPALPLHPAERALAVALDGFGAVIAESVTCSNHIDFAAVSTTCPNCSTPSTNIARSPGQRNRCAATGSHCVNSPPPPCATAWICSESPLRNGCSARLAG